MEWDQDVFLQNVDRLLDQKFNGVQARLNELVGRDAVTRWRKGDRPSLQILIQLTEIFSCTLNDLALSESIVDRRTKPLYKESNLLFHDRLEKILHSGRPEAEAVKFGLEGAYNSMHHDELVAEITSMKQLMAKVLEGKGDASAAVITSPAKKLSNVK